MTLAEFILARVAVDEAAAQRGAAGLMGTPDGAESWHTVTCGTRIGYWADEECTCGYPARVLRQCEAFRRIVERSRTTFPEGADDAQWAAVDEAEVTCGILASIWSDHPDYRQEWAA